jgi:hypothetical protein
MRSTPVVVSKREEDILQAIYSFRFLTISQVCRLFFSETSINYAGKYLKQLHDARLLYRFPMPSAAPGNRELLYTLSRKGIAHLDELGYDMQYWTKQKDVPLSYLHLQHSMRVSDFLIAARVLERDNPGTIRLQSLIHDFYLRHEPLTLCLNGGHSVSMVPDAFIDFRVKVRGVTYQTAVWSEIDLCTEDARYLRRKVSSLHAVVTSKTCQDYFHADSITVAFATTGGEKRQTSMRKWIEEELRSLQASQDGDLFLVTSLPPVLDPAQLFLHPVWSVPFTKERQALLDLS